MLRTLAPLLSAALLFGCSSSASTPDPAPKQDMAPKVVQVPASKQYVVKSMQRSLHQAALYMPENLSAQAQRFKPCQVNYESGVREVRVLTYDKTGRLIGVKTTRTNKGAETSTQSTRSIQYDDQGHLTSVRFEGKDHGKPFFVTYEYDAGVLARAKAMSESDGVQNVSMEQKVLISSSGETVVFEQVLNEGDTSDAGVLSYTFDDEGRVLSKAPMFKDYSSTWRYNPVDANDTQRVDFKLMESGMLADTHTLKGGRLVLTTSAVEDPLTKEYKTIATTTYTYEGDALVSMKTVSVDDGKTLKVATYDYTCG